MQSSTACKRLQVLPNPTFVNCKMPFPHLQCAVAAVLHDQPQALAIVSLGGAAKVAHALVSEVPCP